MQKSSGEVGSDQTLRKLSDRSSSVSPQQPTSPTTVPADVPTPATSTTPAPPPASPVTAGVGLQTHEGPGTTSYPAREHLLDLTAENKSIASKHRLHPKTRSSVLQAVENWFGGVREPPAASRVMVIHGPAGSGKTCLAAELCRRYSGRRKLLAGHFFHWRAGRPDHNRAISVLLSLAYRMCELVGGYVPIILRRNATIAVRFNTPLIRTHQWRSHYGCRGCLNTPKTGA